MKTYAGVALAILMGATGAVGGVFGAKAHFDKKNTETVQVKDGEISELSTKLAELQESLTTKEEELIALKITNKSLSDEKVSLQEQIAEKDATILSLEEQLENAEIDSDVAELQAQLEAERTAKAQLETQLAEKTSQIEELQSAIATKENVLAQAQTELATLQSSFNALQESYNNLALENSNNAEQVNSLTGQMAVLNARITELESQLEKDPSKKYLTDSFALGVTILKLSDDMVFASSESTGSQDNFSSVSAESGLYRVNADYSLTKIFDGGSRWKYGTFTSDGRALIASGGKNILVVAPDNSCIEFAEVGSNLRGFFTLSNGCTYFSSNSGTSGLFKFSPQQNSIVKIETEGWAFAYRQELSSGKILMASGDYKCLGLYVFDVSSDTISCVKSDGCQYKKFWLLSDGRVVVHSSYSSNSYPTLIYDETTDSCVDFFSGFLVSDVCELNSGKLLVGGNVNYLKLFDLTTFEETSLAVSGKSWGNFYKLKNGKVLTSSNTSSYSGVRIFDETEGSLTSLYNQGYYWDTFVEDEDGVTITSSVLPEKGTLYYNYADGKITKVS